MSADPKRLQTTLEAVDRLADLLTSRQDKTELLGCFLTNASLVARSLHTGGVFKTKAVVNVFSTALAEAFTDSHLIRNRETLQ